MGSSPSIQARACTCNVEEGNLPYAIYEAAKNGFPANVLEYLKKGKNVNAAYKGETMLHAACANGRENVLTILLNQRDLCLNVRNYYNETPLMHAAGYGYIDCVETILVHTHNCQLEVDCKNNYGHSALDVAHLNNRQDVAYCLMSFIKNRPPLTGSKKPMNKPKNFSPSTPPALAKDENAPK